MMLFLLWPALAKALLVAWGYPLPAPSPKA